MKYCKIATDVTQQCYPIVDKAVSRRGRSLQGISQPGKFAEVWNTTVVKQEGANVT